MENSGIYVGLDIGTTSIKVVIAEFMKGQLNIIGYGSSHSAGLSRGVIVDIDQVVATIKETIKQAEQFVKNKAVEKMIEAFENKKDEEVVENKEEVKAEV